MRTVVFKSLYKLCVIAHNCLLYDNSMSTK